MTNVGDLRERAESYLGGHIDEDAGPILTLRKGLRPSDPVLAARLSRRLAQAFLRGEKKVPVEDVDDLWKACKADEAFGLARRVLGERLAKSDQITGDRDGGATRKELREQRALCTSKDPDLSASIRHAWALRILNPAGHPDDHETQGIAGGIWKRRWEWDGHRSSLEQALVHYRRGMGSDRLVGDGYPAINCAFVLDLLADLTRDTTSAAAYRDEADSIRNTLHDSLHGASYWVEVTRAEAQLGLAKDAEVIDEQMIGSAVQSMKKAAAHGPDPWEFETTLRQFVRLGAIRNVPESDVVRVLYALIEPTQKKVPKDDARCRSVLIGRVGLALSGGGFRASLYHLGVLARLAESDVLRHVEVLSCVSGGSIVGAHYYLALREKLMSKGALTRDDYVTLVKRVIEEFRKGVASNVRMRVISHLRDNYKIVRGDDAVYADRVAREIHEAFFRGLDPAESTMDELLIQPVGAPANFHPGRHNWERANKVPILVINATTLNSGHNWQFTARSMGESPFAIHPEIDSNRRFRRPGYAPGRRIRLSQAVAASACVPGIFAPLQLDQLYDGYDVRLVDGGVYDNQGTTSLLEQDCQVLLVSDASGQLQTTSDAPGGHVGPLLRSSNIFQERMRQASYDGLVKRKEAGQVKGLAYVHLTQGLRTPAVDWVACEDPSRPEDQLPMEDLDRATTGYGVDKGIQELLASIRTDLDVFSEIESAALMASGYQAMDAQLQALHEDVPSLEAQRDPIQWWFAPAMRVARGRTANPEAFDRLGLHIAAGSSQVGRLMKLDPGFKIIALVAGTALGLLALGLLWWARDFALLTVGAGLTAAAVFAARRFVGNWAALLVDPRQALAVPGRNLAGALVLWVAAQIALRRIDPAFRELGRLETLEE